MDKILKEPVLKCLEDYKEQFEFLRKEKLQPRDFDNWIGGFIAGYSLKKNSLDEITNEEALKNVTKLMKELLESDFVKNIGVTGTAKEIIKILEI